MIELYTSPTPNGYKTSVALEELEIPYNVHVVNLMSGDQKKPEFLKLNPNGRIPVIVDTDNDNLAIMESGAQLIYLAEKAGKLLPTEAKARANVMQWLMFQMGGVGPMMGQANVFYRYFPEKLQSVIDRYQNESKRLFTVIDKHLQSNQYLAQDFSIADIANWSWIRIHKWSGVEIEDLPNLKRWMDEISLRPACIKGVQIPRALELPDDENSEKIKEFEKNAKKILQK